MVGSSEVVWGGLVPVLVAAATLSLVWKLSRRATAAWLCGLGCGYVVGHWGIVALGSGWSEAIAKSLSPKDASDCLPLAVVAALAVEAVSMWGVNAARSAWVLRFALCVWLPWRLLSGSVYLPEEQPDPLMDFGFDSQAWSNTEALLWLGGATSILAGMWASSRFIPNNVLPRLRASLATFVALGGAATIALSGSLTTGQLLGVLTAALVGCGFAASAWKLEVGPEGAAGPLIVVLGGVLIIARFLFYEELGLLPVALLLLGCYCAIGSLGPANGLSTRTQFLIRSTICVLAISACVVPAAREFAATQSEQSMNPYQSYSP